VRLGWDGSQRGASWLTILPRHVPRHPARLRPAGERISVQRL